MELSCSCTLQEGSTGTTQEALQEGETPKQVGLMGAAVLPSQDTSGQIAAKRQEGQTAAALRGNDLSRTDVSERLLRSKLPALA